MPCENCLFERILVCYAFGNWPLGMDAWSVRVVPNSLLCLYSPFCVFCLLAFVLLNFGCKNLLGVSLSVNENSPLLVFLRSISVGLLPLHRRLHQVVFRALGCSLTLLWPTTKGTRADSAMMIGIRRPFEQPWIYSKLDWRQR